MTNPDDCAFPADYRTQSDGGLTKREYIAARALQGLISDRPPGVVTGKEYAEGAVEFADLLIEALNRKK